MVSTLIGNIRSYLGDSLVGIVHGGRLRLTTEWPRNDSTSYAICCWPPPVAMTTSPLDRSISIQQLALVLDRVI